MKNEMKFAKKDAMLGMKAMKLCEKKQRLVARYPFFTLSPPPFLLLLPLLFLFIYGLY